MPPPWKTACHITLKISRHLALIATEHCSLFVGQRTARLLDQPPSGRLPSFCDARHYAWRRPVRHGTCIRINTEERNMMLDLLVRGGTLADGRTNMDIAVQDGRIVEMRPAITASAIREIDASGHLVSTPFVDAHFHGLM